MVQQYLVDKDARAAEVNGFRHEDASLPIETMIRSFAEAIVEDKSLVQVGSKTDEWGTTVTLNVAPKDIGRVLGKQGRIARSLRTILQCVSVSQGRRVSLAIGEAQGTNEVGGGLAAD
jgi:predicted RNA-binding protein YlqC (UPF0109 family)